MILVKSFPTKNLCYLNNKYKLYFDDGKFEYKVRENAYDTMDTIWNASRSVDDLENYLINNQTTF